MSKGGVLSADCSLHRNHVADGCATCGFACGLHFDSEFAGLENTRHQPCPESLPQPGQRSGAVLSWVSESGNPGGP
jgi:hypothetical protein